MDREEFEESHLRRQQLEAFTQSTLQENSGATPRKTQMDTDTSLTSSHNPNWSTSSAVAPLDSRQRENPVVRLIKEIQSGPVDQLGDIAEKIDDISNYLHALESGMPPPPEPTVNIDDTTAKVLQEKQGLLYALYRSLYLYDQWWIPTRPDGKLSMMGTGPDNGPDSDRYLLLFTDIKYWDNFCYKAMGQPPEDVTQIRVVQHTGASFFSKLSAAFEDRLSNPKVNDKITIDMMSEHEFELDKHQVPEMGMMGGAIPVEQTLQRYTKQEISTTSFPFISTVNGFPFTVLRLLSSGPLTEPKRCILATNENNQIVAFTYQDKAMRAMIDPSNSLPFNETEYEMVHILGDNLLTNAHLQGKEVAFNYVNANTPPEAVLKAPELADFINTFENLKSAAEINSSGSEWFNRANLDKYIPKE